MVPTLWTAMIKQCSLQRFAQRNTDQKPGLLVDQGAMMTKSDSWSEITFRHNKEESVLYASGLVASHQDVTIVPPQA